MSTEPDYDSISGFARWTSELADKNTTVSVFGGYGRDVVSPLEAPPGQQARWPASHERLLVGASVAQILSPSLLVTVGLAATEQRGTLSNPYRRAVVRTTLFPEQVPDERTRVTGLLALAWHLGAGTALHLRQGTYADSWGVRAFIPEVMLAKELGPRWLLAARYRYYAQSAADFYLARYRDLLPEMSGDPRLGTLREHALGFSARFTVWGSPGAWRSGMVYADLEGARLEYRQISLEVRSLIASAGWMIAY